MGGLQKKCKYSLRVQRVKQAFISSDRGRVKVGKEVMSAMDRGRFGVLTKEKAGSLF